jgi:hypothetical protein
MKVLLEILGNNLWCLNFYIKNSIRVHEEYFFRFTSNDGFFFCVFLWLLSLLKNYNIFHLNFLLITLLKNHLISCISFKKECTTKIQQKILKYFFFVPRKYFLIF